MAVTNTCMFRTCGMDTRLIIVVSYNDALSSRSKFDMGTILRTD